MIFAGLHLLVRRSLLQRLWCNEIYFWIWWNIPNFHECYFQCNWTRREHQEEAVGALKITILLSNKKIKIVDRALSFIINLFHHIVAVSILLRRVMTALRMRARRNQMMTKMTAGRLGVLNLYGFYFLSPFNILPNPDTSLSNPIHLSYCTKVLLTSVMCYSNVIWRLGPSSEEEPTPAAVM